MLDALAFALDELILAFALLLEARQAAGAAVGDTLLEAIGVLGDDELVGADDQRSLREHDVALVDLDFLDVIDADAIGFQADRFLAVGPLGEGGGGSDQQQRCKN